MDRFETDFCTTIDRDQVERFFDSLCSYKDFLDSQPCSSSNTFDEFIWMCKCQTCDTIMAMFDELVINDRKDIENYVFAPFPKDYYLDKYNSLHHK